MGSKRKRIVVFAGVIVAAAVSSIFWPREREPVYQGKKLSEWLKEYRQVAHGGSDMEREAAVAVRAIGTNALPWLERWIATDVCSYGPKLRALPRSLRGSLLRRLVDRAETRYLNGMFGFDLLGAEAAPAASRLCGMISQTNSPPISSAAFTALVCTRGQGLLVVAGDLTNSDLSARSAATNALLKMADLKARWAEEADYPYPR